MLRVGSGLPEDKTAGTACMRLPVYGGGFSVAFHTELLNMGRQLIKGCRVRNHCRGRVFQKARIPHTDQGRGQGQVLSCRAIESVPVHGLGPFQQFLETVVPGVKTDGHTSHGGGDAVTPADEVKHMEGCQDGIGRVIAGAAFACNRHHMAGRVKAALFHKLIRLLRVGQGFHRGVAF